MKSPLHFASAATSLLIYDFDFDFRMIVSPSEVITTRPRSITSVRPRATTKQCSQQYQVSKIYHVCQRYSDTLNHVIFGGQFLSHLGVIFQNVACCQNKKVLRIYVGNN